MPKVVRLASGRGAQRFGSPACCGPVLVSVDQAGDGAGGQRWLCRSSQSVRVLAQNSLPSGSARTCQPSCSGDRRSAQPEELASGEPCLGAGYRRACGSQWSWVRGPVGERRPPSRRSRWLPSDRFLASGLGRRAGRSRRRRTAGSASQERPPKIVRASKHDDSPARFQQDHSSGARYRRCTATATASVVGARCLGMEASTSAAERAFARPCRRARLRGGQHVVIQTTGWSPGAASVPQVAAKSGMTAVCRASPPPSKSTAVSSGSVVLVGRHHAGSSCSGCVSHL